MGEYVQRYLSILRIELLDLESDLEAMERLMERRYQSQEITYYVSEENRSFIRHEVTSIQNIINELNSLDFSDVTSVDCLIERIDTMVMKKSEEYDLPESIRRYIKRKLDKIKEFVSMD